MSATDLNESPRPRVLVLLPGESTDAVLDALEGLSGTVEVISDIVEVNPDEWDAIVTFYSLGRRTRSNAGPSTTLRLIPPHLQAIVLLTEQYGYSDVLESAEGVFIRSISTSYERGKRAAVPHGLPDDIRELVRQQLAPTVATRTDQVGLRADGWSDAKDGDLDTFRPLLLGPNDLVYAATYERAPGSSVWVIPADLPELKPWFRLAFDELRRLDPDSFPGSPDWSDDPKWLTPAERAKADEIAAAHSAFRAAEQTHQQRVAALEAEYAALRSSTAAGERLLIAGQNLELQEQVRDALSELGFAVEDMDLVWDPREPREDYRITDVADPGWMVIGDATGTTKGVKGTKLMTTERFVTKFVKENPDEPIPNFWLIANQFVDRDPDSRPASLVRGDELGLVEASGSLVIDTVGLFHLLMAARDEPGLKDQMREMLRKKTGEFTAQGALEWIASARKGS